MVPELLSTNIPYFDFFPHNNPTRELCYILDSAGDGKGGLERHYLAQGI